MPVVEAMQEKRLGRLRRVWVTIAALVVLRVLPIIHSRMPDGITVGGNPYAVQFV